MGAARRILSQTRTSLGRREDGFTLVEVLLAFGLLLIVAGSLAGLLAATVASHKVARERTIAEQFAAEQIESIRVKPYTDVGTPSGNPPGTVPESTSINVRGLTATATVKITYVTDPTPTSYAPAAHYKKVVLTVTRDRDLKRLTRQVTYVSPPGRSTYAGVNNAVWKAQVQEMGLGQGMENVRVNLETGPSAPRSDLTDPGGNVEFAGLTANPNDTSFYDLEVVPPAGYEEFPEDVSPNSPAHQSLAPSEVWGPSVLRLFRPSTITVNVSGVPTGYSATVTVTRSSTPPKAQTFTWGNGAYTINTLAGEKIAPSFGYTVSAADIIPPTGTLLVSVRRQNDNNSNYAQQNNATVRILGGPPNKYCGSTATKNVPDNYPNGVYTSTFNVTLTNCSVAVPTQQTSGSGQNAGQATFALTLGSGYTVQSWKTNCSGSPKRTGTVSPVSVPTSPSPLVVTLNSDTPCPIP